MLGLFLQAFQHDSYQAGLVSHLARVIRIFCNCGVLGQPISCNVCHGFPSAARDEVSGEGGAGKLQFPERVHEAFCDCYAEEQLGGDPRAHHQMRFSDGFRTGWSSEVRLEDYVYGM